MWRNMPRVIHNLQFHILHQMRSYSCQDHLTIELYLFLGYLGIRAVWGKMAQIPLNQVDLHKKKSRVFNSLFHIKWDLTLVSRPSVGRIIPVSQVLRYWDNLGKLHPNTPNHVQGHMKSNTKSSAPCFTSNETLLQCQDPLWVELYLFHRYLGIGAIWGNGPKYPNHVQGHMKSNTKSSAPCFTTVETLL